VASLYLTCGICGDDFKCAHPPVSATPSADSFCLSDGLRLPCPNQHSYCFGCLSQYIKCKLDPDETGKASEEHIVFPLRCPECPLDQWAEGIQDDVAETTLSKDTIKLWVGNCAVIDQRVFGYIIRSTVKDIWIVFHIIIVPTENVLRLSN
jgi:hypothetical protein